jgi:hypothetical protein
VGFLQDRRSARTGRRPRKFERHSSICPAASVNAGVRPLRAPRANPVFRTDEKRIRTENRVMDKSKSGLGLPLYKAKKKPGFPGFFIQPGLLLDRLDVDSLVAFLAGRDVERHFLVFLEALEAVALDCREVREQILAAAVGGDKAETLGVVEPFNGTCTHVYYS